MVFLLFADYYVILRHGLNDDFAMNIFGVGMNYLLHTQELDGKAYRPQEPVIFLKPESAILKNGKPLFVPDWSERVDYEAELVVRICRLGKGIEPRFAHRYWDAVTVGIDFTARDWQQRARAAGLPWTLSKGFDGSAAIGRWLSLTDSERPAMQQGLQFHLDVNGQTVQRGCAADMLFTVDELISYLSRFLTLRTGDLIFTGTPAGVGSVHPGDRLQGYVGDVCTTDFYCR